MVITNTNEHTSKVKFKWHRSKRKMINDSKHYEKKIQVDKIALHQRKMFQDLGYIILVRKTERL